VQQPKGGDGGERLLRGLYGSGALSHDDLEKRLVALAQLENGELKPLIA
jgi:hypothetical protein